MPGIFTGYVCKTIAFGANTSKNGSFLDVTISQAVVIYCTFLSRLIFALVMVIKSWLQLWRFMCSIRTRYVRFHWFLDFLVKRSDNLDALICGCFLRYVSILVFQNYYL